MRDEHTLHQKYIVERTDGSSRPGERNHGNEYLVLDVTDDLLAREVAWGYASMLPKGQFRADLYSWLARLEATDD